MEQDPDPRAKRREYERQYRERNRERIREYQRQRYKENPEREIAKVRKYQATEKGIAAAKRAQSPDNPVFRAKQARYRATATENNRRWYYRNIERTRTLKYAAAIRRKERSLAAPGTASAVALLDRAAYWGWRCWICKGPWDTWDHVKPIAVGGSHWPANRRPVCTVCNSRKGAHWPLSV